MCALPFQRNIERRTITLKMRAFWNLLREPDAEPIERLLLPRLEVSLGLLPGIISRLHLILKHSLRVLGVSLLHSFEPQIFFSLVRRLLLPSRESSSHPNNLFGSLRLILFKNKGGRFFRCSFLLFHGFSRSGGACASERDGQPFPHSHLLYSKNTQCVWVRGGAHLSQLVVMRATTSPVVQAWRGRSSFRDDPRPVCF